MGDNIICNRLTSINGKIYHDWMSESFDSYKLKCKQTFLAGWLVWAGNFMVELVNINLYCTEDVKFFYDPKDNTKPKG